MPRDINDLADDWTLNSESESEQFRNTFLSTRSKTVWASFIDEIAKDVAANIAVQELTANSFGEVVGKYYRKGLERSVGEYADLPRILEEELSDEALGDFAYLLNELSYEIRHGNNDLENTQQAIDALVGKLLTRHGGQQAENSLIQDGGTVAEMTTQLFGSETVASNLDLLVERVQASKGGGFLTLLDEPQMMTPLWDHQRDALEAWITEGRRGYVDMATATGKTVLALAAIALRYGELHPADADLTDGTVRRDPTGKDEILIVAHNELILEQWRREFDDHLNIPRERTEGGDDIELTWGRIHFRTAQGLVKEDRIEYDLVLLDEAHHYATGSDWGELLKEFDTDILALSGSVDDAGADSERIQERLEAGVGPRLKRYTIQEAEADDIIPSFDWEVRYAPFDGDGSGLETLSRRAERSFKDFRKLVTRGDIAVPGDRRLRTYEDIRRFSHTTEGRELKESDDSFRDLTTQLFSRRTKRWNLSPSLDAVVDLVCEHCVTEKVVVLADSNAQVAELETRLTSVLDNPESVSTVTGSQDREDQLNTVREFDNTGQSGALIGTGDLLGEGVDMETTAVAVNMATGGVNPQLVQRIGRVLRNPDEAKHAMFYNVVGTPQSEAAAVPREDGKRLIKAAAEFCALGSRFNKLPGFATAADVDQALMSELLQEGGEFMTTLIDADVYDWPEAEEERDHLTALSDMVKEVGPDVSSVLGAWEEYAWEHSSDRTQSHDDEADKPTDEFEESDEQEVPTAGGQVSESGQHDNDTTTESMGSQAGSYPSETGTTQDEGHAAGDGLSDEQKQRIQDLIREQPTKQAKFESLWGMESETEVYQYLERELEEYHYRDEAGMIQATDAAHIAVENTGAETGVASTTEDVSDENAAISETSEETVLDEIAQLTDELDQASDKQSGADGTGAPGRSALLAEIRRLAMDTDEPPTKADIHNDGVYSIEQYETEFGTWSNAVSEAGFRPRGGSNSRGGYLREEVLEELRTVADTVERPPKMGDIDAHAKFTTSVVYNYFDSLPAAREAAGVADVDTSDAKTAEQIEGPESETAESETTPTENVSTGDAEIKPDTDVQPNPLAEYYELFRTLETLIGELIETEETEYRPDLSRSINKWREAIQGYVDGTGPEHEGLGSQQYERSETVMSEYRAAYGDGDRITEYPAVETAALSDVDRLTLTTVGIIESDESIRVPVALESGTPLSVAVTSDDELERARDLLSEFPTRPAISPPTTTDGSSASEAVDEASSPPEPQSTPDSVDAATSRWNWLQGESRSSQSTSDSPGVATPDSEADNTSGEATTVDEETVAATESEATPVKSGDAASESVDGAEEATGDEATVTDSDSAVGEATGTDEAEVITVQTLNTRIAAQVNAGDDLNDVRCVGEVSDCHATDIAVYFTLESDGAAIECVCWQNRYRSMEIDLETGMEVILSGSVDYYVDGGKLNIKPWEITLVGEGDQYTATEELACELEAQGWFDDRIKQSPPTYPNCVGVVTSSDGDARHDITDAITGRYPDIEIRVQDASVQGDAAPEELATGLTRLDRDDAVDVIIIGRGGGSDKDLRAFDTKTVAEAIHAADTPVVTAVGHQDDRTIADRVADVSAITPTEAGILVVRKKETIRKELATRATRIEDAYRGLVESEVGTLQERVSTAYRRAATTELEALEDELEETYHRYEREHEREQAVQEARATMKKRTRLYKIVIVLLVLTLGALCAWVVFGP